MSQLTEFPDIDLSEIDMFRKTPAEKKPSGRTFEFNVETLILGFLLSTVASFVLGGLLLLDGRINSSLLSEEKNFQWLVFVTGEPLDIDDAGRALAQYPHVKSIHYVNSQDAFGAIASSLGITPETEGVDVSKLPGFWQIGWDYDSKALFQPDEMASDMKLVKGVVDVAFDRNRITRMMDLILYQKILRTSLGVFILASLFWGLYVVGRFFYVTAFKSWTRENFFLAVILDAAGWALGFWLLGRVIGLLPWQFALAGIFMGIFHQIIYSTKIRLHGSPTGSK